MATQIANLGFFKNCKDILASRTLPYYGGPILKLTAFIAEAVFPSLGGTFSKFASNITNDAMAFDSLTFACVDAPGILRGPCKGENGEVRTGWKFTTENLFGFFHMGAGITSAQDIRCKVTGHCPEEREAAVVDVVDLVGDISQVLFVREMARDAIEDHAEIQAGKNPKLEGVSQDYKGMWMTHLTCEYVRKTIWYMSATATLGFSLLSAQDNMVTKALGPIADRYAFKLAANAAKGGLGLISIHYLKKKLGTIAEDNGKPGSYKVLTHQNSMGNVPGVHLITPAEIEATEGTAFTSGLQFAQYVVGDRGLTCNALKLVRSGLLLPMRLTCEVFGSLLENADYVTYGANIKGLDTWIKKKYAFAKLTSIPSLINDCLTNAPKHWANWNIESFQFFNEKIFSLFYDWGKAIDYLAEAASYEFKGNAKWLLNEAKNHWAALFMGMALAAQFSREGERARYVKGAINILNSDPEANLNWRATAFFVERTAVIAMTGLTLYNWTCDIRGKKWEAFGSIILLFDSVKAVTTLYNKRYDTKSDGFLAKQTEAYLKIQGIDHAHEG